LEQLHDVPAAETVGHFYHGVERPPDGVAVARVWDTKAQHTPMQLMRLPTTVDPTSWTGPAPRNPEARSPTLVPMGPLVDASLATTLALSTRPVAFRVVTSLIVGAILTGQSIDDLGARRPLSL
jgi:hypothetical protein